MKDATQKPGSTTALVDDAVDSALEEVHRNFGGDLASFFEALRKRQAERERNKETEQLDSEYPPVALARLARKH